MPFELNVRTYSWALKAHIHLNATIEERSAMSRNQSERPNIININYFLLLIITLQLSGGHPLLAFNAKQGRKAGP